MVELQAPDLVAVTLEAVGRDARQLELPAVRVAEQRQLRRRHVVVAALLRLRGEAAAQDGLQPLGGQQPAALR